MSDFDEHVPAFVREFYYEEVQTLLYSNEVPPSQKGFGLEDSGNGAQAAETATDGAPTTAATAFDPSSGEAQLTFFEKLWLHLKRVSDKEGAGRSEEKKTISLAETICCGQKLGPLHAAGPPALNDNPTGMKICFM